MIQVLEDPDDPSVSDFAVVKYTDNLTVKNFVVINIRTGQVIITPKMAGMPVVKVIGPEMATFNYDGSDYLPELNSVVITASYNDIYLAGKPYTQLTKFIDLSTGKVVWESDTFSSIFLPVVTADKNLLFIGDKTSAKINAKTGQPMWTFEVVEKKNNFEAFDADIYLKYGYFYQKKATKVLSVHWIWRRVKCFGKNLWPPKIHRYLLRRNLGLSWQTTKILLSWRLEPELPNGLLRSFPGSWWISVGTGVLQ